MNKKTKVEVDESDPTVIIVNGEKFRPEVFKNKKIDGIVHRDRIIYKKIDENDFNNNLNILVKELSKRTNTKELLGEILKNLVSAKLLKQYVKEIKAKKRIKKHHGCLGFKIGKSYLQVIE